MSQVFSSVSFRPIAPSEASKVCELAMRVFNEFVAPGFSAAGIEEFARYANSDALDERLRGNHFVLVAEAVAEIVGVVEAKDNRHISMLFVSSSGRGQGIGAGLVRRAIQLCQSNDPAVSEISVHAAPDAVPFYRQLGFREQGGEQVMNGIRFFLMSLQLSNARDGG